MAKGIVSEARITRLANALRRMNGTDTLYRPADFAAAVEAFDGSRGEGGVQLDEGSGAGLVDEASLTALADAIRAKLGDDEPYTISDMTLAVYAMTQAPVDE